MKVTVELGERPTLRSAREVINRHLLGVAARETDGSIMAMARYLGENRVTVRRLLVRYGMMGIAKEDVRREKMTGRRLR